MRRLAEQHKRPESSAILSMVATRIHARSEWPSRHASHSAGEPPGNMIPQPVDGTAAIHYSRFARLSPDQAGCQIRILAIVVVLVRHVGPRGLDEPGFRRLCSVPAA